MRRAALAALALALIFSASAQASYSVVVPDTPEFADPYVLDAIRVANVEWAAENEGPSCKPRTSLSDAIPMAAAVGLDQGYCAILFNPTWLGSVLARINGSDVWNRRAGLRDLCHVVVHEVGHLLGHPDEEIAPLSGVMTVAVWSLWLPSCTAWINVLAPVPADVSLVPTTIRPAKGLGDDRLRPGRCRTRRCKRRACHHADLTLARRFPKLCSSHHRSRR